MIRRRALRMLVVLLALAGLVSLLYVGMQDVDRSLPSPLIGKPAPDLPPDTSVSESVAEKDWRALQPVVVNFWASWCQPCLVEHPQLMAMAAAGVPIIGVNYKDEPVAADRWLAQHGNPFTLVLRDLDGQYAIDWGVYGVPESYIVDANGVIRSKQVGVVDRSFVMDHVSTYFPRVGAQ